MFPERKILFVLACRVDMICDYETKQAGRTQTMTKRWRAEGEVRLHKLEML